MTTVVQTTVDSKLWKEADQVLKEHGMTVEDALSALLTRVVSNHEYPSELRPPNAETLEAIAELDRGEGHRYTSTEEMFADIENW